LYHNNEISNAFIETFIEDFKSFDDSKLRNICLKFTYEFLAEQYSSKFELKKGLFYGEELIQMEPNSKLAQEVIIFDSVNLANIAAFSQESFSIFDSYCTKYPFMLEDRRVVRVYIRFYGVLIYQNLNQNDDVKIMEYFGKFEKLLESKKEVIMELEPDIIAEVYLFVGRTFYGKSKNAEALEIFNRGLKYLPENAELKKMAKWAKEDMD